MSTARSDPDYQYILRCPCGDTLTGDTEDDLVDTAFAHLRQQHPDKAGSYEREHILFMALRLRR